MNSDPLMSDAQIFKADSSPKKRGLGGMMEPSEITLACGFDFSSGNGV